jgi:hypothetical protein
MVRNFHMKALKCSQVLSRKVLQKSPAYNKGGGPLNRKAFSQNSGIKVQNSRMNSNMNSVRVNSDW